MVSSTDLSALVSVQQAVLGDQPGEIVLNVGGGHFPTAVIIGPNQTLRMGPGHYTSSYAGPGGYIQLKDHTTVIGSGWNTILHEVGASLSTAIIWPWFETQIGWDTQYFDITIKDLQVIGEGARERGESSAINLGNVVNGFIDHVYFNFVKGIGAQMGGSSPIENSANPWAGHGENQWITNCLFVGTHAVSVACVNASNTHVVGNTFRKQGGGSAAIDYEPNTSEDRVELFTITDNLIDLRRRHKDLDPIAEPEDNVPSTDGEPAYPYGIVIQSQATPIGLGSISNNTIFGGWVKEGRIAYMSAVGIQLLRNVENVLISNNNLRMINFSGIIVEGRHNVVQGNRLQDVGGYLGQAPPILIQGRHCLIVDNTILNTIASTPWNSIEERTLAGQSPDLQPDYNQIRRNYLEWLNRPGADPDAFRPSNIAVGAYTQNADNILAVRGSNA